MLDNIEQNKSPQPQVTTLQRDVGGSKGSVVPYVIATAVISFIGLGIVGLRYSTLNSLIDQSKVKLEEVKGEYATVQEYGERVNRLATVLSALQEASSKQIAYNDVLQLVQNSAYTGAKIDSLNIKDTGNVAISGMTSTYNEFAKFVKSIRGGRDDNPQGLTSSVQFGSVAQDYIKKTDDDSETQVPATTFTISFTLKRDLFLNPASFIRAATKGVEPTNLVLPETPGPEATEETTGEKNNDEILDAFSDSLTDEPPSSSNL